MSEDEIETQAFNFVRPVDTVKGLLGDAGTTEAHDTHSGGDGGGRRRDALLLRLWREG